MAYDKQTWQTGDVVTSAKLNHIEQGIANAGGSLIVTFVGDTATLNKTWQEIHDAALVGVVVLVLDGEGQTVVSYLKEAMVSGNEYQVAFDEDYFIASSADGYPVYDNPY